MSRRILSLIALPIATAALLTTALTGCAPTHPTQSAVIKGHHTNIVKTPAHSASPTPAATHSPSGPAPLAANVLLRITATVTAPGGAAADLVQTVYLPTAITAAQRSQLNADCPDFDQYEAGAPWQNNYASSDILASTMTATLHSGSPAWNNSDNSVLSNFVGLGDFSGAYKTFEADCAPGYISIPGTETAIAPIQASNPSGQNYGWAGEFGDYGFYGGGNDPTDPGDLGGQAVVSNCAIQLSVTAAAVPVAAAWAAKAPGYKLIDGCEFQGAQLP